jgi:ribonucleotide reductase alpha subunit
MLEQKDQPAEDITTAIPHNITQLEGIRQKVFMDRYSLKDTDGKPLEFYPEQLWARVARGIAAAEQTEEKREEWERLFYEALTDFKFVPGGRILAGAGTGHQVTYYNCFVIPSPEDSRQGILDNLKVMTEIMARGGGVGINLSTLRPRGSYIKTVNGTASGPCSWAQLYSVATGDVIQQGGCFGPNERITTDRGLIPAKELADRLDAGEVIQAQTHKGLRPFTAVFRNGIKDLYEVTTSRGYQVRVTPDHKMGVLSKGEIVTIPLHELEEGDEILLLLGEGTKNEEGLVPLTASPYIRPKMCTTLNENVKFPTHLTKDLAYLLGYFYGDGYVMRGKKVTWQDEKGISLAIANNQSEAREHLVSLIRDLFGLEPVVSPGGGACMNIRVYSRMLVEWLQENGLLKQKAEDVRVPEAIFRSPSEVIGSFVGGYFEADGCDRGDKGGYGIDSVSREILEEMQLLLLANGIISHIHMQDRTANGWRLIYRLIVTGAQFKERFSKFIQGYKDKQRTGYRSHYLSYPMEAWKALGIPGRYYQGLFDATKERVSHYALTRVRERVLAAGGVDMVERLDALLGVLPDAIVSIKPLGPSEVYDFEVDDVHLLAGGGIYTSNSRRGALMLMLDDTHPDVEEFITVKKQKGMIEHANLSVCISDPFMEAVTNDANWDLIWQGEVKKTIRARHLWDLICTSAWESAEPGLVFMDRCNKEANTWYYESIRCVNPCVTGDTLVTVDHGRSAIPIKKLAEEEKDVPVLCTDLESETRGQHTRLGRFPRLTQKNAEVWKLTLSDGSTFRATPDHKMILSNGDIRQLKDLHLGDALHSFSSTTHPKCKEVVSVEPDGYADVYNITVDDFHTVGYMTDESGESGIFTLNCGEQPLPFWGVCNLGALNLSAFVKDGSMDWEQLAKVSKIAMRFLDNVIDATEYFIADNEEAQLGTRRTGLGTMGLADALIKMKVPYGSEGSLPIIEHIYATIRDASYEASADIAAEKGPFPKFDQDKYMQGKFIKHLPKPIQDKIKKQGIRNAVLLTQAPTGTTSLLAGVSSGIEPVYDFAMIRRDRTGEHILYHPLLQAWRDEHPDAPTPSYFVSSKDLTPEEHVGVQAMVQRYTDASISKTVNAPNDHTVEQVQKLYRLAYEMGCKGVTYYRDGSRDAVLTRVEDEKKAAAAQTSSIETVTSIHQGIKQRPAVVQGYTRQVNAPEGKVNVTINSDEQGPFEVFVNVGKAGSDIAALSEALGRLISLNLQILSPLSPMDRAQEISKQLRSIGGSRSVGFGVQQVRSLPDAVARALELHVEATQVAGNQETTHNADDQANNHSQQISTSAMQPLKVTGNLCSQCGCNTMVYEEGCKKCYSCGYSEC